MKKPPMKNYSKIRILPEYVMKRIAAGEVIERPASAVKELLENAIDADALSVTMLIKGSGSDLIQVIDNGEGMTEEDALHCCERHATSKISDVSDLENIRTLGFRGEALASIAAVSRLKITTRTASVEEGTQVELESGRITEVQKVAARPGTSVAVRDLFYNTPARRKFLKSPGTELRHILTVFRKMAVAYHEREFVLFVEGEKTVDLPSGTVENRIKTMLGDPLRSSMIRVENAVHGFRISGFICAPGNGRKTRENQFLYLNRRAILNRSIQHAIYSAYGPRLGRGEHPVFILFIEMDPDQFDVNVHPAKIEVRFSDERFIHEAVRRSLQASLRQPDAVPGFGVSSRRKKVTSGFASVFQEDGQLTLEAQRPTLGLAKYERAESARDQPRVWQLHNRYILSQIKSGLTIIDQHVAHERVLYEKALNAKQSKEKPSQQLLFPQTVQLSHEDFRIVTEIITYLNRIGFGIKEFGKNTVLVESVPVEIKMGSERKILLDIIDMFKEECRETADIQEAVAKAFACKTAVKSGDRLSDQEMTELIDSLFATEDPYFCPHGRPIVVNLSLEEIDKRFGR